MLEVWNLEMARVGLDALKVVRVKFRECAASARANDIGTLVEEGGFDLVNKNSERLSMSAIFIVLCEFCRLIIGEKNGDDVYTLKTV